MLNLRFRDYHPTRGRTTPIPRQQTLHDLQRQRDIARQTSAAATKCVTVRGPPLRTHARKRTHDTAGLGTEASRTAPATQYAPRQPGEGGTEEARCFRDGAVESAATQRGPVRPPSLHPPAATPPPALPRSRAPRNGSSAQGACERGLS